MARARSLKPGFFTDAELIECEHWVRLLFAGLWTIADRDGRLLDRPKQIGVDLFPRESLDIDAGLNALAERGFIVRYDVEGVRLIWIKNFSGHQNPHKDERASTLPPPAVLAEHGACTVLAPCEPGANPADSLNRLTDSSNRTPDSGLLGEGAQDAPAKPKRAQQIPEDWGPTPRDREWALGEGLTHAEMVRETPKFIRHHRSKGNVFKDISAAWKNWMVKSREFGGSARSSPNANGPPKRATAYDILAVSTNDEGQLW